MNTLRDRPSTICDLNYTDYVGACHLYGKSEKTYYKTYQVFINIYGVYSLAKDLILLPKIAYDIAKAIDCFCVLDVIYAPPRFIADVTACLHAQNLYDRITGVVEAVSEACNIVSLASEIIRIAKEAQVLQQDALAWTMHLNYAYIPNQFIMMGQSLDQLVYVIYLKNTFPADEKEGCEYVISREYELKRRLSLSKKCTLIAQENNNTAFLEILKTRINTCCNLAVLDSITTVASTAMSCIALMYATTALMLVLYTATTVSSIALVILNKHYLSNKL